MYKQQTCKYIKRLVGYECNNEHNKQIEPCKYYEKRDIVSMVPNVNLFIILNLYLTIL